MGCDVIPPMGSTDRRDCYTLFGICYPYSYRRIGVSVVDYDGDGDQQSHGVGNVSAFGG